MVHVVAVTRNMFPDPQGADAEQLEAACATVRASHGRGVPVIVMQDDKSPTDVGDRLEEAGAIVVGSRRGGGYNPLCVGGALLASRYNSAVQVVVGDISCAIGSDDTFFTRMAKALADDEFVIGERGPATLATMPAVAECIERLLLETVYAAMYYMPSPDIFSGIFGMRGAVLRAYAAWNSDAPWHDWRWPVQVAINANNEGHGVGRVLVDFTYPAVEGRTLQRAVSAVMRMAALHQGLLELLAPDTTDQVSRIAPARLRRARQELRAALALVVAAEDVAGPAEMSQLALLVQKAGGVSELMRQITGQQTTS